MEKADGEQKFPRLLAADGSWPGAAEPSRLSSGFLLAFYGFRFIVPQVGDTRLQRDVGRQRLRTMSKTMFGNADRLEVAEAVADSESGVVNGQELHERLEISSPRVRAQLLALCDAGLVVALPRVGLRQGYQRVDAADPFWALVSKVAKAWRDSP